MKSCFLFMKTMDLNALTPDRLHRKQTNRMNSCSFCGFFNHEKIYDNKSLPVINPNAETKEAIQEVKMMRADPNLGKTYTDVDKMMEDLLS